MSYKSNHVSVMPRAGRFHIVARQGDRGPARTVAIREFRPVAEALAEAIRVACREHTDDAWKAQRATEVAADELPSDAE